VKLSKAKPHSSEWGFFVFGSDRKRIVYWRMGTCMRDPSALFQLNDHQETENGHPGLRPDGMRWVRE